ncbi:MFS transporter [Legionella fallonii]|uniref:Lysosomal dipeptide transporter MFSD1 n=1 Tax=Legionella fallonii LLAP-10 TaxID=1212491 RepID=A0A098G3Z8_9GAMM|nr:MFS transporter [Legionella fallonii]CEG56210.1 Major facilitator family transporter (Permease) [Legionella fallonii LLAP-10]
MNTFKDKHQWIAKAYPWIIWTIAASFFFYKYLIQVSPSVMTDDLMKAFQVHGAGLGNLSAFYFYAYLVMQIPVGLMLDRYSPRLLTTTAIFVCSISTYIFSQTDTFWVACASRALMGAGAAFAAVSCFKLAAVWFSPKRFALVSGMFMTAAMLGAVGGQVPLSILVQNQGWRNALEIVSVMGIVLGVIYFLVLRDKPTKSVHPHHNKEKATHLLKHIVTNKQAWALSLYSGLAFAPVSVFGGLWGVPFLEKAYQLSRTDAALAVSCIFIGFAAGAPFWGWFSDYIKRRKPVLFIGTFSALICLLIVLYSPSQVLFTLMVLLFIFGFGASGFFTSFAMIRELFPLVLVATVLGIMNTFNAVFEALFEPVVGAILDWTWGGEILNGMHQFSIKGYYLSLSLLPLSLILSLIMLTVIKETHCRVIDEN